MVMAAIQNDQQDGQQHVQVEDWSKRSSVQFTLQASILNDREMVATFVIFGNRCLPNRLAQWPATCSS